MDEITKREQHSSSFINEIVPDSDFSFLRRSFGSFSSTLINAATSKYQYQSKIENEILKSPAPIASNESEEIEALGTRGIWLNKQEVLNFNGQTPLNQYRLNDDPNPELVRKAYAQPIEYNQEISVRYLQPPQLPEPGDLIIRREPSIQQAPAPPLILRQYGGRSRSSDPPVVMPIVIREKPPKQPMPIPRNVITLKGQPSELPPRKVIIEKLPQQPPKPANIIIEKWLPYPKQRRRVIFEGDQTNRPNDEKPRNLIIQWDTPETVIKKTIKNIGIQPTDPVQFNAIHESSSLKDPNDLPDLDYDSIFKFQPETPVKYTKDLDLNIKKLRLTDLESYTSTLMSSSSESARIVEQTNNVELYGDLDALKYLDHQTLENEGLINYKLFATNYDSNNNNNNNSRTPGNGYSFTASY